MSHEETTLSGQVTDVFAHRFVVKTEKGKVLADLGPKGAERISLKEGDRVELAGDMKPSELKVHSIAKNGAAPVHVGHPPKPHPRQLEHEEADPGRALKTVEANGFTVLGRPRRKPKHFEFSAATRRGTSWNCTSSWTVPCAKPARCTKTIQNGQPKSKSGVSGPARNLLLPGAFRHDAAANRLT